jgi:PHD/YefM family antitoxin component YafN of YafNO toxin-antitoxin module
MTMNLFSSSDAKQKFGQLLKDAASAPVAIEKHGRVAAYLTSPEFFESAKRNDAGKAARQIARAQQALVEKDRLIRHHQIALDLVTVDSKQRDRLIKNARAVVLRWRAERLCSADYIERWEQILKMQPREMGASMVSDADGWGPSLRQNSPWVGVHA